MLLQLPFYNFNPRSHEGSDDSGVYDSDNIDAFQSTLPRGERQQRQKEPLESTEFQSTLPRGERHKNKHIVYRCICISIHAPTRGATRPPEPTDRNRLISIHAPTRGATTAAERAAREHGISIHAPTRGATEEFGTDAATVGISIHAPTRGATTKSSTSSMDEVNFNPRSHEGSDLFASVVFPHLQISIHAPTRGATETAAALRWAIFISIHAPTRGATSIVHPVLISHLHFNPRSHEGSDIHGTAHGHRNYHISIHAPTRGATAIFAKKFSFLSAKIV